MEGQSAATAARSHGMVSRYLAAGAIVALLDLLWAGLVWVVVLQTITPIQLPQSIARGLIGSAAAYGGGWRTAFLGLGLHCVVAYGWTLVYWAAVRGSARLRRQVRTRGGAVRTGLLYGALVWVAMTQVVMPLSRAGAATMDWLWLINLGQHALMVGLPIVLVMRDGEAS